VARPRDVLRLRLGGAGRLPADLDQELGAAFAAITARRWPVLAAAWLFERAGMGSADDWPGWLFALSNTLFLGRDRRHAGCGR
jgi:hypothetical protein